MKVVERQIEGEKEFVSLNPIVYTLLLEGFLVLGRFRHESKRESERDGWVQSEGHAQFSIATRPEKPFFPHESFQNCHTCLGL